MGRHQGFHPSALDASVITDIEREARLARGAVLTMTSVAGSGHPGGSFSSMEMLTLLYAFARIDPLRPDMPQRDRIVVSHGHTSPGVYAVLGQNGFFPLEEAVAHFRQAGSIFEGHVERTIPGIEWSTGNLGQGLSAGVGLALGARLTGRGWHTFVAMSDGEQHKGQVAEARRLAVKERLGDLTVIVDLNGIQISGSTSEVMPVAVAADYAADGWGVIECDGHDVGQLYSAIAEAVADVSRPYVVVAHTIIGKGVSFMEGRPEFHGRALKPDEYEAAMVELGLASDMERFRALRDTPAQARALAITLQPVPLDVPPPITYPVDSLTDDRSAWGAALVDIARANPDVPVAVLDCDLAVSVKTDGFAAIRPDSFIQCGVGEHNAATVGGALSTTGVLTFWSDFGVFGVDEVYNQQRLNDLNDASLKLVVTHCGLDVGEDGKTHQCLDYVGAFRDFFGWRVVVPADPNQTDRAVREIVTMPGNVALAMGRSRLPVLSSDDGRPLFGDPYGFTYGEIVWARHGGDGTILTMGTLSGAAVAASDLLRAEGLAVGVGVVSCPLDLEDGAMRTALATPWVLVVEDHHWRTGLWASVVEWAVLRRCAGAPIVPHGVRGFSSSGTAEALYSRAGLDSTGIAERARSISRA